MTADSDTTTGDESERKMYRDLTEGDRVRFVKTTGMSPDRKEREGVVVEADLDHPIYNWAFTMYRIETEKGSYRVQSADIEALVEPAEEA